MRIALLALVASLALLGSADPAAAATCKGGHDSTSAMWLSIAHPGLGEWYLKGWGAFSKAPQNKFWLGFIPLYGWPGYLQVRSAIDASRCQTLDRAY